MNRLNNQVADYEHQLIQRPNDLGLIGEIRRLKRSNIPQALRIIENIKGRMARGGTGRNKSKWIPFVKKIKAKYKCTYSEALKKASKLWK